MHWRRATTAAACLAVLAGCQGTAEPSPDPSVDVAPPSPAPSATPSPSPDDPGPIEVTPAKTLSFGEFDFDGFSVGQPLGQFAAGFDANRDACGADGPFRFVQEPGPPEDNPWVLWVATADFDGEPNEAPIEWFGVEATVSADLSEPLGPEGPHGLRLGSTEGDLLEVHPEAPVQEYLAEYYNETYLLYTVNGGTDVSVVYAVRDGVVVDIRWGSPSVAVDWEHLLCNEGDAPFDW